ncbi:MAG TPA: type II secretion system F family protein [Solirubrobacteraceae bacterium]
MTAAVLMAGVAGVLGVLAAWETLAAVDQRLAARAIGRWLAPLRRGGQASDAERRRLAVVAAGALCAAGWLIAGPVAALGLGAAAPAAVNRALAATRARRRAQLASAAPAVARALADALSGGHSIRGAIAAAAWGDSARGSASAATLDAAAWSDPARGSASRATLDAAAWSDSARGSASAASGSDGARGAAASGRAGPAGAEMSRAAAALDAGAATEDVLEDLRSRASDPGWDTLVAAILLQRDAGGDLAHLLRRLAERIENAQRAEAEARAATAQARFTAWLVACLPAGAALLAELGSPGYVASLFHEPLTAMLVATSVALQLAAILAVRRIAKVAG